VGTRCARINDRARLRPVACQAGAQRPTIQPAIAPKITPVIKIGA
jgi:hypothetical protein